jgi:hypothetical protein
MNRSVVWQGGIGRKKAMFKAGVDRAKSVTKIGMRRCGWVGKKILSFSGSKLVFGKSVFWNGEQGLGPFGPRRRRECLISF